MNKFEKVIISLVVLAVLIFGLYAFTNWFSKATGYVVGDNVNNELANCLSERDLKVYVSADCDDCEKQLNIVKEKINRFVEVVPCDNGIECFAEEFPSWEINGKVYNGLIDLNKLIEISGC